MGKRVAGNRAHGASGMERRAGVRLLIYLFFMPLLIAVDRYVYDNYTWDRYGPEYSLFNGNVLIPSRIPLSTMIAGPFLLPFLPRFYNYNLNTIRTHPRLAP